jgi:superfamily II DNA/RNA helicase
VRSHERFAALGRLFETEPVDGALVFVRTKAAAAELANNLAANGISAAPLSGDLSQPMREATVERLKNGELDVIVATDVAARGLDVERITHVINYDKPFDAESYVHRIGRTGRAGREGTAILFVQHRDRHVLGAIERTTGQRLEEMEPPSSDDINQVRVTQFKERMTAAMESDELALYARLIDEWCRETGNSELDAAVALAAVAQRGEPLLLPPDPPRRPARARMDFGRNDQGRGRGGPRRDGPHRDGPHRDGPHRDGPHRGGPRRDGPNNDNAERGADTRGPDTRGSQARGPQRKDEGPARATDTRGPGETAPPRRKPVGAQQHVVDDRPADGTGPARRKSSGKPPGKPAKPRTKTASKAGAKPRKRPSAKAGAKAGGAAKPPPKPHRKGKKPS